MECTIRAWFDPLYHAHTKIDLRMCLQKPMERKSGTSLGRDNMECVTVKIYLWKLSHYEGILFYKRWTGSSLFVIVFSEL